jgi:hypothetical protein
MHGRRKGGHGSARGDARSLGSRSVFCQTKILPAPSDEVKSVAGKKTNAIKPAGSETIASGTSPGTRRWTGSGSVVCHSTPSASAHSTRSGDSWSEKSSSSTPVVLPENVSPERCSSPRRLAPPTACTFIRLITLRRLARRLRSGSTSLGCERRARRRSFRLTGGGIEGRQRGLRADPIPKNKKRRRVTPPPS